MRNLKKLLNYCERNLGETGKEDLDWYDNYRPKTVSAKEFFNAYAWALLVSGIKRKAAESWKENNDFDSVFTLRNCRLNNSRDLIKEVGSKSRNKFGRKLKAIHRMGVELCGRTSKYVSKHYFGGIKRTTFLDERHVDRLDELEFVGKPNARFIIRNMGGELIKDDRWIKKILKYFKCTVDDLVTAGERLGWKAGRVDTVLWSYCAEQVKLTANFSRHFKKHGFKQSA